MNMPKWKIFLILSTCFLGILFALPNVFNPDTLKTLPSWMPKQQLVLGLDLQGGSQLLMEVDLLGAMRDRMAAEVDDIRTRLLKEKFGYLNLAVRGDKDSPFITFTARDPHTIASVEKTLLEMNPNLVIKLEGDVFKITYSDLYMTKRNQAILEQSIGIISRRIDEDGTKEPVIQRQGDNRILIQLPGISNPEQVKEILNRTAKLAFRMVDESASVEEALKGKIPPGSELLYEDRGGEKPFPVVVKKRVVLTGENLVDASVSIDQKSDVAVSFKFDSSGSRKFAKTTRDNIGKRFAIILDNKIISAPNIQTAIEGGSGIITGNFTTDKATELALLMRAGALPASLTLLSESTVGPELGADSIYAGQKATMLSIAFVGIFMLFAYSFFGLITNIALIVNIILLIAGMTLIQATLTLPGIAGIALTIGMAVDANVLICERIKEELRNGRKLLTAIELGYNRAMATIVDANVTTLFGSGLLYVYATGAIKGFAVTLSMGIIISMFTAVSLTRLLTIWWVKIFKPTKLPI